MSKNESVIIDVTQCTRTGKYALYIGNENGGYRLSGDRLFLGGAKVIHKFTVPIASIRKQLDILEHAPEPDDD